MICKNVAIKQQKNEKLFNTLQNTIYFIQNCIDFFLFMTTKYENNVCEDYLTLLIIDITYKVIKYLLS